VGGPPDNIEGAACGAGGSLIFEDPGEQLIGVAGQVLVVPKLTPHKFEVVGPERYIATHIHASETFITEWLEGPKAQGADPAPPT
jgi:mannose-6-phosphate isomerase-like protein (cupin superfamily)